MEKNEEIKVDKTWYIKVVKTCYKNIIFSQGNNELIYTMTYISK